MTVSRRTVLALGGTFAAGAVAGGFGARVLFHGPREAFPGEWVRRAVFALGPWPSKKEADAFSTALLDDPWLRPGDYARTVIEAFARSLPPGEHRVDHVPVGEFSAGARDVLLELAWRIYTSPSGYFAATGRPPLGTMLTMEQLAGGPAPG